MRVLLIRHGESTSDVENRYGGDYDDVLTPNGQMQADELAVKLGPEKIQHVFTSSKLRAKETAETIAGHLNLRVTIVDDLREQNRYGVLSGMEKNDALKHHPTEVAKLADGKTPATGGEPYDAFRERVLHAFSEIADSPYDCVAVVTHGGPIKAILGELGHDIYGKSLQDCAVIEVQTNGSIKIHGLEEALQ